MTALAPLAVATDLSDLLGLPAYTGIKLAQVERWLDAASDEIRSVLGQQITRNTTTAILPGVEDYWLELPQIPVVSVESAVMSGGFVADFRLIGNKLYRWHGWQDLFFVYEPSTISVTYTHGYATVPGDLVTLCCSLASVGMAQAATGALGHTPGITDEAIDDYKVGFDPTAPGVITIPAATVARLRAKYAGGGVTAVLA